MVQIVDLLYVAGLLVDFISYGNNEVQYFYECRKKRKNRTLKVFQF